MFLAVAGCCSAQRVLWVLLAATLSCAEAEPTVPTQPMAPAGAGEPSGEPSDGSAANGCEPGDTRSCGNASCVGVERCIAASGGTAWQPCDVSGAFLDAALLAVVRRQLRAPEGPLFELAVRQLEEVAAANAGIASLEGMQCLVGLSRAELFSNDIVDVAPLAGLSQLRELTLQDNAIVEVAPLAGLTQLESLQLHINQIRDVQPLAGLTGLRQLALDENQLGDIAALSGLVQLEQLFLGTNQLSDIAALSGLVQLKQLFLGTNQLSDIAPVAALRQLTWLQLTDNAISDLTPLSELGALEELLAEGNQIRDVTPLLNLLALQRVTLDRNPLDCAAESLVALRTRLPTLASDCP